jgi:hypothetical protein
MMKMMISLLYLKTIIVWFIEQNEWNAWLVAFAQYVRSSQEQLLCKATKNGCAPTYWGIQV